MSMMSILGLILVSGLTSLAISAVLTSAGVPFWIILICVALAGGTIGWNWPTN